MGSMVDPNTAKQWVEEQKANKEREAKKNQQVNPAFTGGAGGTVSLNPGMPNGGMQPTTPAVTSATDQSGGSTPNFLAAYQKAKEGLEMAEGEARTKGLTSLGGVYSNRGIVGSKAESTALGELERGLQTDKTNRLANLLLGEAGSQFSRGERLGSESFQKGERLGTEAEQARYYNIENSKNIGKALMNQSTIGYDEKQRLYNALKTGDRSFATGQKDMAMFDQINAYVGKVSPELQPYVMQGILEGIAGAETEELAHVREEQAKVSTFDPLSAISSVTSIFNPVAGAVSAVAGSRKQGSQQGTRQ